jgi:hypothetical protein
MSVLTSSARRYQGSSSDGQTDVSPSLLNRKYNPHLVSERKHNLHSAERKYNLHSAERKHNLHLITYIHIIHTSSSTKDKHTQSSCITYIHRAHISNSIKVKQKHQVQQKLNNWHLRAATDILLGLRLLGLLLLRLSQSLC